MELPDPYVASVTAPASVDVARWLRGPDVVQQALVEQIRLEDVHEWSAQPDVEEIAHERGAFFSVVGISARRGDQTWEQPILRQSEVGLLGIALTVRNGRTQALMQGKAEPGTVGGVQLSTTVQATHSNLGRRHGGREVPYVHVFDDDSPALLGATVPQSENGRRFLGKRNLNAIRHVAADELDARPGFVWTSLGDLHRGLRTGEYVSFDARTVLAQFHAQELATARPWPGDLSPVAAALVRGSVPSANALHPWASLMEWLVAGRRVSTEIRSLPLTSLAAWERRDGALIHRDRDNFSIIGLRVRADGREVTGWDQPIVVESGETLLGLALTEIRGVLHAALQLRRDPGLVFGAELGPTITISGSCPESGRPPREYLAPFLYGSSARVLYDQVLSAEGGRFLAARQRHVIVLTDQLDERPGYRWVALHQWGEMIRRGMIVDEHARSLYTCLITLLTP